MRNDVLKNMIEIGDYRSFISEVEKQLLARANDPILEPDTFLEWNGTSLLSAGTLLTIQGKAGSFKSWLAQEIAATLLEDSSKTSCAVMVPWALVSGSVLLPITIVPLPVLINSSFLSPPSSIIATIEGNLKTEPGSESPNTA